MSSSDPVPSHADPVNELLKQAAADYCQPALRALGCRLPADDAILAIALNQAADGRDAKAFKARRNDPCPCGSGKKFKQCCDGRISTGDQYEVGGVTISDATAHPELILTARRISEMRGHELYTLKPKHLTPEFATIVVLRLALFHECSRVIEMLQEIGRGVVSDNALDEIAYHFFQAREIGALRWLLDWAPESVEVTFEMEVLLADPQKRLPMLRERAREAFEAEQTGDPSAQLLFSELGNAALLTDPALGIVVARGVLPVCGRYDQVMLIEDVEAARDILGLDDDEPGYEIVDATARASLDETRHAMDLEKVRAEASSKVAQRDAKIRQLTGRIDSMQETLKEREEPTEGARVPSKDNPTTAVAAAPATPDSAEIRELRDQLRRLNDSRKVEHEELNRAIRELRVVRKQQRRATREEPENQEPAKSADSGHDAEEAAGVVVEWERQPLRIPEYGPAFRKSLRHHPRQVSAAALAMAGRLASGEPSTWKMVSALKLRHGTLRVRVAGDYRLLFEIGPEDALRLVDFILRRDLDRWLAAAGR